MKYAFRRLSSCVFALLLCSCADAAETDTLDEGLSLGAPSARSGLGAVPFAGGTTFRVWAPNADAVGVVGEFNNWSADALQRDGGGYWSADIAGAAPGDEYRYVVTHAGNTRWKLDPRSAQVTNSVGNSVVPELDYPWAHRLNPIPANEAVIYEMHIGTFHDSPGGGPGTFRSAIDRLDHVQSLGANVIELLPVAEFAGDFSWGYNPAHPFAVETAYGPPREFKRFVDECHRRGIAVILDVVYNHLGPSDLDMWCFDGPCFGAGGIYFFADDRRFTPWGATRPDYGRNEVREYLRDNALFWLNEYRIDGLRFDSTGNMRFHGGDRPLPEGWGLLRWINDEIDFASPWKLTIAEDHRGDRAISRSTSAGGAGFDSQWDASFSHAVRRAVNAPDDRGRDLGELASVITNLFNGQATQRVIYTESHDEVASGRSRVPEEIWPGNAESWASRKRSTLAAGVLFTSPGIPMMFQGQEMLEVGYFRDTDPVEWDRATRFGGIVSLYRDLIRLRRNWYDNTRGLRGDQVNVFHANGANKMLAYHRWDRGGPGDDVIVVANFSQQSYPAYTIGFPRGGTWYVRFNSDYRGYSNDFGGTPGYDTTAYGGGRDGMPFHGDVGIGPYSVLILSQ